MILLLTERASDLLATLCTYEAFWMKSFTLYSKKIIKNQ